MSTLIGHLALGAAGAVVFVGGSLNGFANLPELIRGIRVTLGAAVTGQWKPVGARREPGMVTVAFTRPDAPAARLYLIIFPSRRRLLVLASRAVYADPARTRPWHPVVYGTTSPAVTVTARFRQAITAMSAWFRWDGSAVTA